MAQERRRSDRVTLTIRLRAHGEDLNGLPFHDEARTINVNRDGALIRLAHPLREGQVIMLANPIGNREAKFRVVGPVSPPKEGVGEWAVECVNPADNIWAINFPSPLGDEPADSKALLECRECHTLAPLRLTLVEVDVLETAGVLTKFCSLCGKNTPWGYAEKQVAMGASPEESTMLAEVEGKDRRQHRRVPLQLPVLIRD